MRYVALIVFWWQLHLAANFLAAPHPAKPLGLLEKRNACIDLFASANSWRHTLCTMPMDSVRKDRK